MHPQSTNGYVMDPQERTRILARARPALPERPATTVWAGLAWARVSKSVQDTIEDQLAEIHRHAKAHGVPIERERYATGSRWNHHSAEWLALLADIESGQYSHLWLFNADRLAGDDQQMVAVVRMALRKGMRVMDTVHGVIDDNNVGFLGLLSHHDIKVTSERVVLKLDSLPAKGVKVGGVPYGYEPQCRLHPCKCGLHGRHTPHPERKQHVVEAFARVARGDTLESARRWFNATTGRRLGPSDFRALLRNEYYIGVIVGRKTRKSKVLGRYGRPRGDWDVGTHDYPIIDPGTFDLVQARLDSTPRVGQQRQKRPSHALTGLVWCRHCNRRMKYHRATAVSQTWQCPVCNVARGAKKLERAVIGVLKGIPFPNDQAAAAAADQVESVRRELARSIKELDLQLDRIARRRSVWMDQVGDGEISREEFRDKMAESDRERTELRRRREELGTQQDAAPAYGDVVRETLAKLARLTSWTEALENGSEEVRRTTYTTLLARVVVDAEQGTLTMGYTAPLAAWYGRASDTIPFVGQRERTAT